MKFWLYRSRKGEISLYPGTPQGFAAARERQDDDNRCSVEDILNMGLEIGGSEESGHFYIDDGGDITLTKVEEI